VRTINGRGLAVKVRACSECAAYEAALEERLRAGLVRGTATLIVEHTGASFEADEKNALRELAQELGNLAEELELAEAVTLRDLFAIRAQLRRNDAVTSRPAPPGLLRLCDAALADLQQRRAAEGRSTVAAMRSVLAEFEARLEEVAALAPGLVGAFRDRLQRRLDEYLATRGLQLEPADLVREVAMFADRVDVSEELQRLRAHLAAARALLDQGGELGKRLEFLLQELLRETNTLGAKSPDVAIAHAVVAMKSSVEKLKEQAANLE
jgi:uncharacterized protein (TIGR00255 family)